MARASVWRIVGMFMVLATAGPALLPGAAGAVGPAVQCRDARARDQDDMCNWVHPTDRALSTIITSDKAAGRLFVYGLDGRTIQTLPAGKPGNIDLRYGFPLGGKKVDIVAFNQRSSGYGVGVYAVEAATRKLRRIDGGGVKSGPNYGGCLYRSRGSGKLYFITTSTSTVEQHELFDGGGGTIAGRKVRSWQIGLAEGAAADDETGRLYIGEERKGVWEVGAEPGDPAPGRLIARVGEHGLRGDVEGVAIYHMPGGKGYLIVSSQGSNCFKVYRREGGHGFVGTFSVRGARDTDGIDVTAAALAGPFAKGLFACHTDSAGRPVLLTPWERIARSITPPLVIDTSCAPRQKNPVSRDER